MAVYCISDLHGRLDAFCALLEQLPLTDADTLYVLGDVIDRGPDGIALLRKIMDMPNVKMLLGNHERMMLDYFDPELVRIQNGELVLPPEDDESFHRWQLVKNRWDKNRNGYTLSAYWKLEEQEQQRILRYLRGLPTQLRLQVQGRDFLLVHGFPAQTDFERVWDRPASKDAPSPVTDATVIVGHTPVILLEATTAAQQQVYFQRMEEKDGNMCIFHSPGGWIDIDCGIAYPYPGCALACLCLDDMSETYIC